MTLLALNSGDLIFAWRHAPFDRVGGIAFALWSLAGAVAAWRHRARIHPDTTRLAVGLGLGLLGFLAELNVLKHLGLAWAATGFLPASWQRWVWLGSALSWMPVFGWVLSGALSTLAVHITRVAVALGGARAVTLEREAKA